MYSSLDQALARTRHDDLLRETRGAPAHLELALQRRERRPRRGDQRS